MKWDGVRSRMRLHREKRRRTSWRGRGSGMGSDHGCDCTGRRDDVQSAVERERDGVRSRMRLHREKRRRTAWRGRGRGMGSDHGCDCTGRRDDVHPGGGEGVGWGQITDATAQGEETTYCLEVEREWDGVRSRMRLHREKRRRTAWRGRGSGMGSDHGCDCTGRRDDVLSGGGEGARWGQITDATSQGEETTYILEVEREWDGVRSRMRLHREKRRRTAWRWRGSGMGSDHGCNCTGRRDDVLAAVGWGQITDATAQGEETTYKLQWRGSGMGSDHGWDCTGRRDGGESEG